MWKSPGAAPGGDEYRYVLWLDAAACLALAFLLFYLPYLGRSWFLLIGIGGVALLLGLAAWLFGGKR